MRKLFFILALGITALVLPRFSLAAVSCEGDPPPYPTTEWEEFTKDCQAKIKASQAEQKTLAATISYLNSQISLTAAKISKTIAELNILEREISDLSGKIQSLDYSLDDLTKLFVARVRETYIRQEKWTPAIILQANSISEAIRRTEYEQRLRDRDREIMIALEKSRLDYDNQKSEKEAKQLEAETLKKQLNIQKSSLSEQKAAKDSLLAQTKNNERKYQELLSQAIAEKAAIEKALVSGVVVGPVKRGDPIALVGNSGYPGCSTGKHLHFEVRKNNSWTDPGQYLESHSVYDEEIKQNISVGSGSWPWPISDPIRLTQHYGQTPYSWVYKYSGGIHTGYDMVPDSSDVIRAPADGTLYKSSQSCNGSTINIVYIDHGNSLISLYLHVQ